MIRLLVVILLCAFSSGYAQVQVTGGFDRDTVSYGKTAIFTLSVETSGDEDILAVQTVFLDSVYSALSMEKDR